MSRFLNLENGIINRETPGRIPLSIRGETLDQCSQRMLNRDEWVKTAVKMHWPPCVEDVKCTRTFCPYLSSQPANVMTYSTSYLLKGTADFYLCDLCFKEGVNWRESPVVLKINYVDNPESAEKKE